MASELANPQRGTPLSPRTIALVQESWAAVLPIADAAATLFYDRLFTLDPSVRVMFKPDISEQKKKLMQTLSIAVDGLNDLTRLVPVLQELGTRHAGYMVAEHHYDLVGEALLWTLQEGLGDAYNDELEAAWKEVYGLVSGVMKQGAAAASEDISPSLRGARDASRDTSREAAPVGLLHALPISESATTLQHELAVPRMLEDPGTTLNAVQHSTGRPPRVPPPAPTGMSDAPPAPGAALTGRPAATVAAGQDVTLSIRVTVDAEPALRAAADRGTAPLGSPAASSVARATAEQEALPVLLLAFLGPILSAGPVALALVLVARPEGGGGVAVAAALVAALLMSIAFASGYLVGRGRKPGSGA